MREHDPARARRAIQSDAPRLAADVPKGRQTRDASSPDYRKAPVHLKPKLFAALRFVTKGMIYQHQCCHGFDHWHGARQHARVVAAAAFQRRVF